MTLLSTSIKAQVISPTDTEWQKYLDLLPHDFYHLPGYLELESQRHQGQAEAIAIEDGDRVFFLPYIVRECPENLDRFQFSSKPIYDVISPYGYPGMLIDRAGQNSQFIEKCLNIVHECWYAKNICSAFLRLHPTLNDYIDPALSNPDRFVITTRGDVVICDLTNDTETIWKQIRSSHRTKINKLKRAGFVAKMVSIDSLDLFIEIYTETMQRVNANSAYFFTRAYFQQLFPALGDRLHICLVEIDGETAAASLVTEVNGIVQYHLGGTKTKFLSQSPTTLMFDYMMNWGKQRGNNYLNLGGGLGSNRDSLYHFKSGFSDRSASFMTMQSIINRELYNYLIHSRAATLSKPVAEFEQTAFFPAYRSPS
ncbi:GNAT family N-acetyltransferase [Chamaesiphon sp. VAR_69_metabat_338]|uniref:lipid II:glycine glycyltransferase FemX n=1 Tax=Chamaesiphon sp. VAR_69_metabat_338 TaxID=2964704 RepID=UPI00286E571C|nr:GNAT family N-acetyltransferase [Chamaesiphon sp. VAR_69_metabat_338]